MVGEENGHYVGRVDKYENGKVVLVLDRKIGTYREKLGKKPKGTLEFNEEDFLSVSGIDRKYLVVGRMYLLDRKKLHDLAKERRDKRQTSEKTIVSSVDDLINPEDISVPSAESIFGEDEEPEKK